METITLRPYQKKFVDDVKKNFRAGVKRVCGVAPCGAGKTIMTGYLIKEAVAMGERAIFFVHRKELIQQTAAAFSKLGIKFGIISSGTTPNYTLPVQIASVQTLVNRLDEVPPPDFVVCDECHHILAKTYLKIINRWEGFHLLGVTATPERLGGIRLGDVFNSMVQAPPVKDLIRMGNLTDFRCFAPKSDLNLKNISVKRGDYVNRELEKLMSDRKIVGNIVANYQKYAAGKSAICYCVNVAHSKLVAENFHKAGIASTQCDGETPKDERAQIVSDFRNGRIKVLCNAELFGEGFDVPNVHAVILARPTKSLTLYIQQAMRPLRPDPLDKTKTAVIIDHVNNSLVFGLPDENRKWSLEPNEEKEPHLPPVKICPACDEVLPIATHFCTNCGYEFEIEGVDLTEHDGELSEVQRSLQKFLEIANERGYKKSWIGFKARDFANSYADFLEVADFLGYNRGWAWHQCKEAGIVL